MAHRTATAFISYSREDSEFVLRLAADLRQAGARIWLDQLDITPGTPWDSMIEQALREAASMLLVLSTASVKSENVRNEISFALQEKKTIIPILRQDCAVPLQLHRLQRIDCRTDYARGLNAVLRELGVTPPAPPVSAGPAREPAQPTRLQPPVRPPAAAPADARSTPVRSRRRQLLLAGVVAPLLLVAGSVLVYRRVQNKSWAHEEAPPQISRLLAARTPLAALTVLERAESYSPSDPALRQIAQASTLTAAIESAPSGFSVSFQDYLTPNAAWKSLGPTPLRGVRLPLGFFRWRLSRPGGADVILAAKSSAQMKFELDATLHAPAGMVAVPGSRIGDRGSNLGWFGGQVPAFFIDRFEVTNRDFQRFVDGGGYSKQSYWTEKFVRDGRELPWTEAMKLFRDTTGRPGPSTWTGGHFPEGRGDFPVSGVSWFEASAYAAFVGKSLPVYAQWHAAAPVEDAPFINPASNFSVSGLAAVGTYQGVGPYGTYDMAGNVREWAANVVNGELRPIVGGSWKSPNYGYFQLEAVPPFDRSDDNGFRCVRNLDPVPAVLARPLQTITRDFRHFQPASDEVFHAYRALYDFPSLPLNPKSDGIVQETVDWRVEKVEYATAYRGERMAAYLFLPKNVPPPYQAVLFFPSARVLGIPSSEDGQALGDLKFFDYIVQSGRAVIYPIYQDTYERRLNYQLPGGSQSLQLSADWYKDAARSLDYLATRQDIDSDKFSYLGVSMGSASGVILSTLLQDRLRTAIFLDGGYFLDRPPPGGDQADFAPRMKKPVLMVNGRYDFTFGLETAQKPLFEMLGTPPPDKRHIVLDTPHDVNEQRAQLTKTVLDWLDKYVGPVRD
jgi:eukaryotic-like serine/threonine-protein kinase